MLHHHHHPQLWRPPFPPHVSCKDVKSVQPQILTIVGRGETLLKKNPKPALAKMVIGEVFVFAVVDLLLCVSMALFYLDCQALVYFEVLGKKG